MNPHAYAVVIGTNDGGPGQKPLAYAEHDARRVARLLSEIGGYVPGNVKLLLTPDAKSVSAALDGLRQRLEGAKKSGAEPVAFFYYSGHARASSLNLGAENIVLDGLRSQLLTLPTALTVVVLDACQSGAFSRVKGAAASADFSFNSVNSLRTRGVAVMASSTASELSQESEELRGSYFTHHLLVGLRGAGDADRDGRVSLDEAYRYAYAGTLTGTARTRVGMQHVTLETDLRGRGDVPVSYPAHASAHIDFPSSFGGNVLLTRHQGGIVAELTKTSGAPLRLAVPPGGYRAIVRRQDEAWECELTVTGSGSSALALDRCRQLPDEAAQAKGSGVVQHGETWGFEAALGFAGHGEDDYTQRLKDFGFPEGSSLFDMPDVTWTFGVSRRLSRRWSAVARIRQLEGLHRERYEATGTDDEDTFDLDAYGLGFGARGILETRNEVVGGYAQLSIGPAFAKTALTEGSTGDTSSETHFGGFADLTLGFRVMPFRRVGFFVEWSGTYAPVAKNLLDERRNSGGSAVLLGLRARTWGDL